MSPAIGQRASAIAALLLLLAVLILALSIVVREFPSGLIVLGCVGVAFVAAWYGLLRRGAARLLGLILARRHPGASPSAAIGEGLWDGVRTLLGVAAGRSPVATEGPAAIAA